MKFGVSDIFKRNIFEFMINIVSIIVDIGVFVINNVYIINCVVLVYIIRYNKIIFKILKFWDEVIILNEILILV